MSPLNRQDSELLLDDDSDHSDIATIANEMNKEVDELSRINERNAQQVRFSTVEIREFDLILGDHPDVRVGPPISFGWDYVEKEAVPLDVYERSHVRKGGATRLSSITRKNLLQNVFHVPEEDIRSAEKEVQRIRELRINTAKQSKKGEKAEAVVQSAKRKLKRRFSKEKLLNAMAHSHSYLTMFPQSMTVAG